MDIDGNEQLDYNVVAQDDAIDTQYETGKLTNCSYYIELLLCWHMYACTLRNTLL
jgi:hypothetical protein